MTLDNPPDTDSRESPVETPPRPFHSEPAPWQRATRALWDSARALVAAGVYALLVVTFVGQVARVEGHSMEPTLDDQDRLVVNKLGYLFSRPRVGDIVMVAAPDEPEKLLVKRIVAGPGDVVRSEAGRLYRNDFPFPDDFITTEFRAADTWTSVVPRGHYFVMGDHRSNSLDSRSFGPVPAGYIKGKVQLRWWPATHGRIF